MTINMDVFWLLLQTFGIPWGILYSLWTVKDWFVTSKNI